MKRGLLISLTCCLLNISVYATTNTASNRCETNPAASSGTWTCTATFSTQPANGDVITIVAITADDDRTISFSDNGSSSYTNAACAGFAFAVRSTAYGGFRQSQMQSAYTLSVAGTHSSFGVTATVTGIATANQAQNSGIPLYIFILATSHTPNNTPGFDKCAESETYDGSGSLATAIGSGSTATRTTATQWLTGSCYAPMTATQGFTLGTNVAWGNLVVDPWGPVIAQESVLVTGTGTQGATFTVSQAAWYRCSIMTFNET